LTWATRTRDRRGVGPGPPPSEIVAYFEAEAAAMENAGCPGTGKPGPETENGRTRGGGARKPYRSLGFVEPPGALHIESSILPGHREQGIHLEGLTDRVKSPISTGRREEPTSP
jgi:hypothetical protein